MRQHAADLDDEDHRVADQRRAGRACGRRRRIAGPTMLGSKIDRVGSGCRSRALSPGGRTTVAVDVTVARRGSVRLSLMAVAPFSSQSRAVRRSGPSARAGKNVSPAMISTTPTTSPPNSGPCVGNVPADSGTFGFAASEPASATAGMIRKNRPTSIATPIAPLNHGVSDTEPGERRPVVVAARAEGVEHLATGRAAPGSWIDSRADAHDHRHR